MTGDPAGNNVHASMVVPLISRYSIVGALSALEIPPVTVKGNPTNSWGIVAMANDSAPGVNVEAVIGVQ